ncbi:MAG: DUF5343 domain-containing protein [Anaerolineae bacterium]
MTENSKSRKYPFAAPESMAETMEFARHPTWQRTINLALLKKMGIAQNNEAKVTSALRFLGIIDEKGEPTPEFDSLKTDYQGTMKRLVKKAYSELFDTFTADMITRDRLLSFFGKPEQGAQRRSWLFIWLCSEAGIELPNVETKARQKQSKV